MTILRAPTFKWRDSGLDYDRPPYEQPSPNLVLVEAELRRRFGGGNMGIHFDRPTSSGAQSEHSWGAGLDWGTHADQIAWLRSVGRPVGNTLTRAQHLAAVDWVVGHSLELHIDAIVDIGRSWKSDRVDNGANGWIDYDSGYTGHCHMVTPLDGWGDTTPIADRLAPPGAPIPQPTPPTPGEDDMTGYIVWKHNKHPEVFVVGGGGVVHVDSATRDLFIVGGAPRVFSDHEGVYQSYLRLSRTAS